MAHKLPSAKMLHAQKTLASRFHRGFTMVAGSVALALIDVLRLTCRDNPLPALQGLQQLRSGPNTWIRPRTPGQFQPYKRAQWFGWIGSHMKVCLEYERHEPWLEPFAVTFYADDRSGLVRDQVLAVLAELPPVDLKKAEVAVDFAMTTPVDCAYIRRYALFGKSRKDSRTTNTEGDWWGSRLGGKRVVSYRKDSVAAQRLEFKLRGRFLRHYRVRDIFDFAKFAQILPRRHLLFARLDEQKLMVRLDKTGMTASEKSQILKAVQQKRGDLWESLDYLRRFVGMKNVRRLVTPLNTNEMVLQAFKEFAAKWPARRRIK